MIGIFIVVCTIFCARNLCVRRFVQYQLMKNFRTRGFRGAVRAASPEIVKRESTRLHNVNCANFCVAISYTIYTTLCNLVLTIMCRAIRKYLQAHKTKAGTLGSIPSVPAVFSPYSAETWHISTLVPDICQVVPGTTVKRWWSECVTDPFKNFYYAY